MRLVGDRRGASGYCRLGNEGTTANFTLSPERPGWGLQERNSRREPELQSVSPCTGQGWKHLCYPFQRDHWSPLLERESPEGSKGPSRAHTLRGACGVLSRCCWAHLHFELGCRSGLVVPAWCAGLVSSALQMFPPSNSTLPTPNTHKYWARLVVILVGLKPAQPMKLIPNGEWPAYKMGAFYRGGLPLSKGIFHIINLSDSLCLCPSPSLGVALSSPALIPSLSSWGAVGFGQKWGVRGSL